MSKFIWSQDRYIQVYKFAARAHKAQTVPGTDFPYLMHLSLVSMEVMAALLHENDRDGDLAVQCALLHDVIEDASVPYDVVKAEFGTAVADGVLALTKDTALPKERQMADSLQRIRQQPPEVWMVKLADRITNLQPPPSYWTKEKIAAYRAEAQEILDHLGTASKTLAARLESKIRDYGV